MSISSGPDDTSTSLALTFASSQALANVPESIGYFSASPMSAATPRLAIWADFHWDPGLYAEAPFSADVAKPANPAAPPRLCGFHPLA